MLFTYANTLLAQNAIHLTSYNLPSSDKSFFRLGDNLLIIRKQGNALLHPFVFISVHNNETTAATAALDFIERNGGQLITWKIIFRRMWNLNRSTKNIH
ncbi:MAG: hypothetical protein C4329_12440 [Chitinophagaceae bacterium]